MPGIYRRSIDLTVRKVQEIHALGIRVVNISVKADETLKDNTGQEAWNPNGLMQRTIKAIKAACPEMVVMPDAVLGPYSIYGHDGILESGAVFGFISKRFSQTSSIKTYEEVLKLITNAFPKSVKVYTIFKCLQKK